MANTTEVTEEQTARTIKECASQRAENLAILGVKSVLELCVGPSLKTLETAYSDYGITVTGNDIDDRWRGYYPKGNWIIGDATKLQSVAGEYDAVVVAPPLTKGCSGKREDALSVEEVTPSYYSFLGFQPKKALVLVLPGKTLSLKKDRAELYKLLASIVQVTKAKPELIPLRKKVIKYLDLYLLV